MKRSRHFACLLSALALSLAGSAFATPVTECASIGICYCINSDYKPLIDEQVGKLRAMIAAERAKGKAVGYLSIPLSTVGGGYFGVNREVGEKTRQRVESRFGNASAWVLNPGMKEAEIPNLGNTRAGGGEYMAMWTRVLEGSSGLGEDFDFFYYVGPTDFASYFGLTGSGDMDRIGAYFDQRVQTDADFRKTVEQGRLTRSGFRNYYALRASVSYSLGSHDEWNIAAKINARRRESSQFGVANQLPTLFDGRAVSSAEAEQNMAPGYAGACKN
jgi:hypothetical protein